MFYAFTVNGFPVCVDCSNAAVAINNNGTVRVSCMQDNWTWKDVENLQVLAHPQDCLAWLGLSCDSRGNPPRSTDSAGYQNKWLAGEDRSMAALIEEMTQKIREYWSRHNAKPACLIMSRDTAYAVLAALDHYRMETLGSPKKRKGGLEFMGISIVFSDNVDRIHAAGDCL